MHVMAANQEGSGLITILHPPTVPPHDLDLQRDYMYLNITA